MYYVDVLIAPKVGNYNMNLWNDFSISNLEIKGAELLAEDCKFVINEVTLYVKDNVVVECDFKGAAEIHPDCHIIGNEKEKLSKAIAKLTDDWKITTEYNIMGQQDLLSSFKIIRE